MNLQSLGSMVLGIQTKMALDADSNKIYNPIDDDISLLGIRIARVSTVPFFVVTQLKHQIAVLGKYGAAVTVITSKGPELALLDGLSGVTCVPIYIPRSISPWVDLMALLRLSILFRCEHTQITHSTTPKAGLLTAVAAFIAGVPVRLHTFTGQPWVEMRGPKRWLTRASDRLIGMLNTRCYTDSASQRKFLIQQGIVDSSRLFCMGAGSLAGVDVRRFDPSRFLESHRQSLRQSLGIPFDASVLLFVGRMTFDKGVRELLEAFHILKATGSSSHLVFVGPSELKTDAEGVILSSHIEELSDVHVAGYTDSPESYMSIAEILCLPSYREGFGTVVIEAAAMGVPTIGTEIYGLSDAVVHGVTGLLVPPRSVEELAGALGELLRDKSMRKMMGEAARQRALTLFDARKVNGQVIDQYRILLQEKKVLQ